MTNNKLKNYIEMVVEEVLRENQPQRLRDIFLEPAKDVINTTKYAAERISSAAQGLVKGLSFIIPTILIPGLEFNYDLFKKDEQAKLDEIKKKYGDTLARNWEAIKDPDVFGFLLLAYPQTMLGFAALKRSPLAFLRLLEVVTGGMDSVTNLRQSLEQSSAYTPRQNVHYDPMAGSWGGGGDGMVGDYYGDYAGTGIYEGTRKSQKNLSEAQPAQAPVAPQGASGIIQQVQALLQTPEVKQAIAQSPIFKDMQNASVQIMIDPVLKMSKMQNLDQMKGLINPEAVEKAKAEIAKKTQGVDPKAAQEVYNEFVQQAKRAYREAYIQKLQGLVQQAPQAKAAIDTAIARIHSLQ